MESSKEFKPIPKPEQHVEQDIQLCKQLNLEIGFEHSIFPLRNGMAFLSNDQLIIYDDEKNVVTNKKIAIQSHLMAGISQLEDGRILFQAGEQEKIIVFSLSQPNEEQEMHSPMHFNLAFPRASLNNTEFACRRRSLAQVDIYHINTLNTPSTSINFRQDAGDLALRVNPINENMLAITGYDDGVAWLYRREKQGFRLLNSIALTSPDIKAMAPWERSLSISGSLNNYLLVTETVKKSSFDEAGFLVVSLSSPDKELLTRISIWELDKQERLAKTCQWQMKDPSITQVQHFSYGPGDIRIVFCKENQLTICHPNAAKPITTIEMDQSIARYHILHSKKILLLYKIYKGYEIKIMQYDPLSIKEKIKNQITESGVNLHGGVARIIANYVHDDIQIQEEQGSKEKPMEESNRLKR